MPFARGVGFPELIILLVIVMLIFGVGKLPEVGNALGRGIREFRKGNSSDEKQIKTPRRRTAQRKSATKTKS